MMKKFLHLMMVFCLMCISFAALAEDYTMPKKDGFIGEKEVNGELTFYDMGGPTGATETGYAGYVLFKPANEGEQLTITFEELDLGGNAKLYIYDGDAEFKTYQSKVKEGYLAELSGNVAGQTFTATSGQLSVLYHCKGSGSGAGWKATITSGVPKDMEYVSTGVLTGLASVNRNGKNQTIFGVDVVTDGSKNALTLNDLTIDCSALQGSAQVKNVRLYKGSVEDSNLLTTATNVGDNLSAKDVTLKMKSNKFFVVADILPDASGEIPSLKIASVKVAGEARTPQAETGDAVAVNNVILMPAQATTFTIGDDALFYDDGGKDGKISSKFTGQVTFVPATAGQKVKIDFSKLAIFNTSSTGYNDILKIYNGKNVVEANLVTTLLTETSKIVKSTSEDGALTMTLTSTTGVPANGWEATVSQFTPGDMTFKGVVANATGGETITAGAKDAKFFDINVTTDNTSKPLKVSAINFKLAEGVETSSLSKVKVYYLGEKNEFKTTNLFGEASVADGKVAISGEKELIEGNNYFAVVADLADNLQNGQKVGLTFDAVEVGGVSQSADETVSAVAVVDNVCRATKGSHSHVMYGDWTFTDTKSTLFPTKYEFEKADYIVTFTPSEAGHVAVLDFSNFDIEYSSSSYSGVRAIFEVYSGKATDADKLLWKLASNADSKVGPGKKLYSDADDGSITIKFNPNTTSSYYAATGWEATVSQFKDHDMTIKGVEVTQPVTKATGPGSKNELLLAVKVTTEGSLSKRVLKSVNLNLKGCQKSLDKVTILSSGGDKNFENATTTYGSVAEFGDGNIAVAGNLTLRGEDNYLWVVVDVNADAESGNSIDASVVSLTTDTGDVAVADGDPEGKRDIKNMLVLKKGDNGVYVVKRPLLLYDDGGPDGVITQGITSTITFVPENADDVVTINTNMFAMGGSKLYLYSGREVDSNNLLGTSTYFNTTEGPKNLSSKAADGSITIKVETAYIDVDGFEVEISTRSRVPFEVTKVEASAATEKEKVVRNSKDAELVKVNVEVDGDKTPLSVDSFKFSIDGTTSVSDIANAKLYYTKATDNFLTDKLVATTTNFANNEIVFTPSEPLSLAEIGNHYFWLAVDVDADANADDVISAKLSAINISGSTISDEKVTSETASRTINKGFIGEYTIGASSDADYATFKAATAALASGVEGAVTFLVEDGTYKENVEIKNVEGTSAEHPIKIVSKSGNRSNVVITGGGYSEPGYGEHKTGMFNVENTPYVTVEGLSFIPSSQMYPYAVLVYNQSRHFTLKNCVVKADMTTSYSGMSLVRAESVNEDGKNNDYMTIEDCNLEGGYILLYLGGTTYVGLTKERGLVVRNNTLRDSGSKGIYVTAEENTLIEGNRIISSKTTKTNYQGMDIANCTDGLTIRNNIIQNSQSAYSSGIYLRDYSGDAQALIYNNAITIVNSPNNNTSAIQLTVKCNNMKVLYNTVNVKGKGGYTLYISGSAKDLQLKNIVVKNNLLQNFVAGGYTLYLNEKNYLADVKFGNNAYYYPEDAKLCKDFATTIEEYAGLTGDATSFVEKADFVSDIDLRLKTMGNMQKAEPLSDVLYDINGKERSTTTPTIGAYEYEEIDMSAAEIAEGYPIVGNVTDSAISVKTKWSKGGKLYAKLLKSDEEAPTAESLLKEKPVDCIADTEMTSEFKGLDQQTAYKAYFVVENSFGINSAVVSSEEIVTARTITDLTLDLTSIYDVIESGSSVKIEPTVTGGDAPYTYEWRNQMNEVVGTDAALTVTPSHTSEYRFTVTSTDGQSKTAKTAVYVTGAMANATFDDNYLQAESYWNGDSDGNNTFYSGSFAFSNYKKTEWLYWEGFSYANSKETSFTETDDQYRNAAGGGADGSDNYAVVYSGYYSTPTIEVTNNEDGETIQGVYINNTSWAVSSMENGDGYATAFTTGDYYKVTFTGYDKSNNSKSVEYYLADYTSENEADHYIVKDWKWVDLSVLGTVKKIEISVSGSQTGTPAYVALDNFGASKPSGIKGVEADGVNIYPVPTSDVLHIDGIEDGAEVKVYAISGQMVGDYRIAGGAIDVSALARGIYVLQTKTANGNLVKKQFVKM